MNHRSIRNVSFAISSCILMLGVCGCVSNVDILATSAAKYSEATSNLAKAGESQLALYRNGLRTATLEHRYIHIGEQPARIVEEFDDLVCKPQAETIVRMQQLSLVQEYATSAAKIGGAPERNIPALVGSIKAKTPNPPNISSSEAVSNDAHLDPKFDAVAFETLCQNDIKGLRDKALLNAMVARPEAAGGDLSAILGFVAAAYEVVLDGLQMVERRQRKQRLKEYVAKANDPSLGERSIERMISKLSARDDHAKELCGLNESVAKAWPCRARKPDELTSWDAATLYARRAAVSRAYYLYLGLNELVPPANKFGSAETKDVPAANQGERMRRITELVDVLAVIDQQVDPPNVRDTVILVDSAHKKLRAYLEDRATAAETLELLAAAAKSTKGILDHVDALRKAEDAL